MNMANNHPEDADFDYGSEQEFGYRADFTRPASKDRSPAKARKIQYARKGRAPVSHNGIHRRRNKRFSW
jgi:hypothetical protein